MLQLDQTSNHLNQIKAKYSKVKLKQKRKAKANAC
jgi:hypothetical protein